MNPVTRALVVIAGVACFAVAAVSQADWLLRDANPSAFALAGFGLWLLSTLRLP